MINQYAARAFPSESEKYGPDRGMSLRDYFAAKALQGYLANEGQTKELASHVGNAVEQMKAVATASYTMADAMLKARGEQ